MSIIKPNMSTNSIGLSDVLFTKVQQRVLGLLFAQADQSFYTNQIQVAFVYGSIAKGSDGAGSDIDLFLIGDNLAYADVLQAVAAFEEQLGRPVNPTLYSLADFNRKKIEGSDFIARILEQPKIFIVGGEGDLK